MSRTALFASLVVAALCAGAEPPVGPLERLQPRIFDVRYDVTISTMIPLRQDDPRLPRHPEDKEHRPFGGTFYLQDAPIVMPLHFEQTFHQIDRSSLAAELWLGDRRDS